MKAKIRVSLLILFSLGLISGCSETDSPSGSADSEALQSVDIMIDWKAEPTYAGFYLAKELGFYENVGLNVSIIEGNGASSTAQIIGSASDFDLGSSTGSATAIAISKDIPVVSVGVFYPNTPTVIYSIEPDEIETPSEIEGRSIGLIPGSTTYHEYIAFAEANELDREEIEEVNVGFDVAPLLNGQVDALMNYAELTPVQLRLDGYSVATIRLSSYGVNLYGLNFIANRSFMENNPHTVCKAFSATKRGYEVVKENPERAAEFFSRLFPEKDPEYVRQSMKIVSDQLWEGGFEGEAAQGWAATLDFLESRELISRRPAITEVQASGCDSLDYPAS